MQNSVLCLAGSRTLNKRMSLFIEGSIEAGFGVRVMSPPRGRWHLGRFESCPAQPEYSRWFMSIGYQPGARLRAIFCFHWVMLPVAILLGMVRRVPVIYDEHDHFELNTLEGGGSWLRRRIRQQILVLIHRSCIPFCRLITCIHMKDSLLMKRLLCWNHRVLELHNYPVRAWRCEAAAEDSPLEFVYVGGVYREKGLSLIRDAFAQMCRQTESDARLHIFGTGDDELISTLRSEPGIEVHGNCSPEAIRQFVAGRRCCGLVILPDHPRYNLMGTNSRKLFEYLASAMPVIVTDSGEVGELVRRAGAGLVVPRTVTVGALTDSMLQIATDPHLAGEFALNAERYMNESDLCWEREWDKVTLTLSASDPLWGNVRSASAERLQKDASLGVKSCGSALTLSGRHVA